MLRDATNTRDNAIKLSAQLETQYEENEFKIADLKLAVDTRLGSLKELFGALQQTAGDTKNKFHASF